MYQLNGKRIFSFLLALVMVFGMMPINAFAAETDPQETTATDEAVANVQAMIDALPTSVTTEEEATALEERIAAVDDAMAELTTAQSDQLDYTNYTAATTALANFSGVDYSQDKLTSAVVEDTIEILDGKVTESELAGHVSGTSTLTRYSIDGGSTHDLNWTVFNSNDTIDFTTSHDKTIKFEKNSWGWKDAGSYTIKVYHNITASLAADSDADAVGGGVTVANNGKVYHNEKTTITANSVADFKAEVYDANGNLVATLSDENNWTYQPAVTASTSYTVKYVSANATEYAIEIVEVNGEYGDAVLGKTSGIADEKINLTITYAEIGSNTANSHEVSVTNGSYDPATGKVTIAGTGKVTVTVTFSKIQLNGRDTADVQYDSGMDADDIKNEIYNKVITGSIGGTVTVSDVEIKYYPWCETQYSGNSYTAPALTLDADAPEDSSGFLQENKTYYNFGERGAGHEEKIIITWGELSVEAVITLVDTRTAPDYTIAIDRNVPVNGYQKGTVYWPGNLRGQASAVTAAVLSKVTTVHDGTATVEFKDENGGSWHTYAQAGATNAGNVVPGNSGMNVRVTYAATDGYPQMVVAFTVNYVESRTAPEISTEAISVTANTQDAFITAVKAVVDERLNNSNMTTSVEIKDGTAYTGTGTYTVLVKVTNEGASWVASTRATEVTVNAEVHKYTLTFTDENGEVVATLTNIPYGTEAKDISNIPDVPEKDADAQYTYTPNDWGVQKVEGDATYGASYTPVLRSYTIHWDIDGDGTADGTYDQVIAYGTKPTVPDFTDKSAEDKSFAGWSDGANVYTKENIPAVTGTVTYTATYTNDQMYTVLYKVDGTVYAEYLVNFTQEEEVPSVAAPSKTGYVFTGWTNADLIGTALDTFPTEDVVLEATWADDANNNGVDDEQETATVKVEIKGADYGSVALSAIDSVIITNNNDGTYTVIYNSAAGVENGNVVTITATPRGTGLTYSKNTLVSAPASVTVADGETATVSAEFKNETLTLTDQTIYINKYAYADRITGFKELALSKVVTGYVAGTADNYTVVVDAVLNYDLDDLNDYNKGFLNTALLEGSVKLKITDKSTGLYGTVNVTLTDSRATLAITTEDVTIEGKTEPADVVQQVKNAISIKATDPETKEETVVAVSDSYISYSPAYSWPDDAQTKTFTVTVRVNSDANYVGTSTTLTLTCTDTTILYTVTYADGKGNTLYSEKHAENTEMPTIEDPTHTYYNFVGWSEKVAETVTGDVTYTATWTPKLDDNSNGIADQEETYTVIYTDGVADVWIFDDAATSELAYGAAIPGAPSVPERDGWNFKGWDNAETAEVETLTTVTGTVAAPTTTGSTTITYQAVWTEAWVVTFEGHTYQTPAEVEDGQTVAEPSDIWDADHDFLGWYNGDDLYDFDAPVTSNLTLTAMWREDYNHNDVDDEEEDHFTVIYVDGNGNELEKFENILIDLDTPTIADPTLDNYKFNGWDPAVAETVTANVTYTAQWLNDINNNDVDDAIETIVIEIEACAEKDTVAVPGAVQVGETNNWVFDSKTVTQLNIVATPTTHISGLKRISDSWVASITNNGEKVELAYDSGFAAAANIPVAPIATVAEDETAEKQTIVITFQKAELKLNDERLMNYYVGMKDVTNEQLFETIVASPAYADAAEITVKYKAREAMSQEVNLAELFKGNDLIVGALKLFGMETIKLDLPELWNDVNVETDENLIEDSVDLNTAAQMYLTTDALEEIARLAFSGDLDGAKAKTEEITQKIYAAAMYYKAHNFGYNDTDSETVTEQIKITYKWDKFYVETETTIDLKDMRAPSYINGNNVSVMYRDYTDEELIALIGAYVSTDAEGADTIEGAVVGSLNFTDPMTMEGKLVSENAYEVTFKFAGDETYKPSTGTFTVSVTKATIPEFDAPNKIITYGEEYDLIPKLTLGNKYGLEEEVEASLVQFVIGLDVADLDVDGDGVTGLETRVQLILTEDLQKTLDGLLGLIGGNTSDGMVMSLSELLEYLQYIPDTSLDALNQALDAIAGIIEGTDIQIILGGDLPKDTGAYLHGSVTTSANYETKFDVGYLVIKPDASRVYLDWNYNDTNGIYTPELLQHVDLGASAFDEEDFVTRNDAASALVNNLFFGIDINGELVAVLYNEGVDPETIEQELDNGAYTQMAFIAEFGNEFYYAVPIIRAFAIVPNVVEVEIVVDGAEVSDLYHTTFDNAPVDVDAILSYTQGTNIPGTGEVTYHYYGIKTNTNTYDSDVAPTNAGAYVITATYTATDENGKTVALGLDVATLVIEPAESTIEVANKVVTVDPGKAYDLEDTLVTVGSTVPGLKPDTTVISAQIASNGQFSENGWDAVTGSINIDFPRWMDDLLVEYAPSVADGMTVAELKEVLTGKLPEITAKLIELGAAEEIVNSFNNLIGNITNLLDQMPADAALTFSDNVKAQNVGAYAVIGIVTDSDHYPAVDAGVLVIAPDVDLVNLKWNHEDENSIWTRELLQHVDLWATAFDDGEYTVENGEATAKITYQFIGIDKTGELIVMNTTNADELPNGAYIELAYIELEIDGQMIISDLIAREIVIVPGVAEVIFVDDTGAENNDRIFTFDNTGKTMDVKVMINGQEVDVSEDTLTVTYAGIQTNGEEYFSTTAPKHAGVYVVTATYTDYTTEGSLAHMGIAAGVMAIEPAESSIEVTGGTVVYDGEKHSAAVTAGGSGVIEPDYTLISGHVRVDSDIDTLGVDAFIGNVNIDLPAWLDEALASTEAFNEGIDAAYLLDLIISYRGELTAMIPTEELLALGMTQEQIDGYMEALNSSIDELLNLLAKMPQDVSLTFTDDIAYTEPGYYFYYRVVTDSDHYPSADTGLLVIEKMPITFDLLDTEKTWNGEEHFVDENNPQNTDFFAIIANREAMKVNLLIDADLMYLIEKVEQILGKDIPDTMDIAELRANGDVKAIIDALDQLIAEAETLELPDYAQKILGAMKEEMASLPNAGTITINGALPTEMGKYEVYAVSYSEYYTTEVSEAVLEIHPVTVEVVLEDQTKIYGEDDPALTYTVSYYDHAGNLLADAGIAEVTITREKGEVVGEYAITAVVDLTDDTHYVMAAQPMPAVFTIDSAKITSVEVSGEYIYIEEEQTAAVTVMCGETVLVEGIDYEIVSGDQGTNAGDYTVEVKGIGNYTGTLTADWSIEKALIVVTADDKTMKLDEAVPELTVTVDTANSKGSVTKENLTVDLKAADLAPNGANQYTPGTYAISGTDVETDNWIITVNPGTLTVEMGDYICWNVRTGTYYDDVTDALEAAIGTGATIQMLKDATNDINDKDEVVVIVYNGLTLDLNGHYVQTANLLSYGVVMDRKGDGTTDEAVAGDTDSVVADGDVATGGIMIDIDTTKAWTQLQTENGGYLPIYDTSTGSYKFFTYGIQRYAMDGATNASGTAVKYSFRLRFYNGDAYGLLAKGNTGVDMVVRLYWDGLLNEIIYTMDQSTLIDYATAAYNEVLAGDDPYRGINATMYLVVGGLDNLSAGDTITAKPTVATKTEAGRVGGEMPYTVN